MNPGFVLFLTIVGFAFILWLSAGGQHWAISYQGPFITPITNYGQVQSGYGPQLVASTSVSLPGGTNASASIGQSSASAPTSTYSGVITIARSTQTSSGNPNQEYLEFSIASHASSPIDLTNWKFVSASTQGTVFITGNVTINPGQALLVVSRFPSSDAHDTIQLRDTDNALVASTSF